MYCTALQFRWGGNEGASEQELAELCETEVSVTQKSPVFFCILLWHSVDVHHLTARENPKQTFFFDLGHSTKILPNHLLMKIGAFLFSVLITLFHPAVFSSSLLHWVNPPGTLKSSRCPTPPHVVWNLKNLWIVSLPLPQMYLLPYSSSRQPLHASALAFIRRGHLRWSKRQLQAAHLDV